MAEFYKDIDNNIIRFADNTSNIGVIITPYADKDRRINKIDSLIKISKKEAHEEINRQWDSYCDKWIYNNKKYRAQSVLTDIDNIKEHNLYIYGTVFRPFAIIQFHGKLYWADLHTSYLPTCPLYEFISETKKGSFCCFAELQHLKPVFCVTDKEFI